VISLVGTISGKSLKLLPPDVILLQHQARFGLNPALTAQSISAENVVKESNNYNTKQEQQQPPFYGHYTNQ